MFFFNLSIISSSFQIPIFETQVYFSSILSKSRLIFLRIKYVQEIMREINSVTAV